MNLIFTVNKQIAKKMKNKQKIKNYLKSKIHKVKI